MSLPGIIALTLVQACSLNRNVSETSQYQNAVIPAQAGIQFIFSWMPFFNGMTKFFTLVQACSLNRNVSEQATCLLQQDCTNLA